jgi:hypothetical protein
MVVREAHPAYDGLRCEGPDTKTVKVNSLRQRPLTAHAMLQRGQST